MQPQIYYIPHGGGPLPLMGEAGHGNLIRLLGRLGANLDDCRAVIVVTAHWEAATTRFSGAAAPSLLFDYYGFPPETYDYQYPAPGSPELARQAQGLLRRAGLDSEIDMERGFDHGVFVPMMLMRPKADIPVLQMSLLASLDPAAHIAIGRALAPLTGEGAAIIGSGQSFHNLGAMRRGAAMPGSEDRDFDGWLNQVVLEEGLSDADRAHKLAHWRAAPGAGFCQPREEHLLPLHVCYGAAEAAGLKGENIFREELMGFMTSGFSWS